MRSVFTVHSIQHIILDMNVRFSWDPLMQSFLQSMTALKDLWIPPVSCLVWNPPLRKERVINGHCLALRKQPEWKNLPQIDCEKVLSYCWIPITIPSRWGSWYFLILCNSWMLRIRKCRSYYLRRELVIFFNLLHSYILLNLPETLCNYVYISPYSI